jgi:VanZ family protein
MAGGSRNSVASLILLNDLNIGGRRNFPRRIPVSRMPPSNQFPVALRVRRFWLLLGWMLVFFVIYLSLTPEPVQVPMEEGDKLGHVLAYAALMSWFANLYEGSARRMQFAIGFIALGITLEFIQGSTGYRSFEVADMAAGAAGVAVGWISAPPRIPNYLHGTEKVFLRN